MASSFERRRPSGKYIATVLHSFTLVQFSCSFATLRIACEGTMLVVRDPLSLRCRGRLTVITTAGFRESREERIVGPANDGGVVPPRYLNSLTRIGPRSMHTTILASRERFRLKVCGDESLYGAVNSLSEDIDGLRARLPRQTTFSSKDDRIQYLITLVPLANHLLMNPCCV